MYVPNLILSKYSDKMMRKIKKMSKKKQKQYFLALQTIHQSETQDHSNFLISQKPPFVKIKQII